MIVAPMIASGTRGPSFEEQAFTAAIQYSNEPSQQAAFIAGAKWEHKGCSVLGILFFVAVSLLFITQLIGAILGILEGTTDYRNDGPLKNKWKFVFPLYNPCFKFAKWMSK